MFPERFSERHKQPPDILSDEIPEEVRFRIMHTLQILQGQPSFISIMDWVGDFVLMACGRFSCRSSFRTYTVPSKAELVVEHFMACTNDEAIDVIESVFKSSAYRGGQSIVDAINRILRERGVGYEFSEFVSSTNEQDRRYPRATKKSNDFLHGTVVMPCLRLLNDPRFKVANDEFLQAYGDYRNANFDHALTSCGSAFESVLKTICCIKGLDSDPDYNPKATLAPLVRFCIQKGVFDSMYENAFISVATIRNALSSAHGRGPQGPVVTNQQVEHFFNLTATHMRIALSLSGV